MKKTLVAIAALAAVGAASAQSSVTLYGRLNMGTSGNTSDVTNAAGTVTRTKTLSLAGAEGINTTQRLGVRGSEDLGGGLKANFNVETKIFSDPTAASTFGATRNAFLQLAGGFGTVTIGTYLNALDGIGGYAAGAFSVAGGDILARVAGAGGATGLGIPTRSTNAIAYQTPNMGGFQGFIGTSNEKTEVRVGAGPTTTTQTDGYMLGGTYDNGPLNAKLVYGRGNAEAAGTDARATDWGATAQYNFGAFVPYVAYRSSKTTGTLGGVANNSNTGKVYEIGAKVPMGALTPYITYANGDIQTRVNGAVTSDDNLKGYQIGAYYDLSKRTYLLASFGQDLRDSNITGNVTRTKNRGYALGLVHSF